MALFESFNLINESRKKTGRRQFLFGATGMVGAYFGYRWWRDRPRPIAQRETTYITSNEDFYNISIYPGYEAKVTEDRWRLEVSGMDGRYFKLSYDELLKLERQRVFKTFMCVGNDVGGSSIGNAEWTVTPLAPIVEKALGQKRDGLRVVFHAQDEFYSSVPLEVALNDKSFIAYQMNGEPLPRSHGYPARILLPNVYGMKQPRWLSKIEVTDRSESGYWEKRGWSGSCEVKMNARIDSAISQKDGRWLVTGIAYCGGNAVDSVEVSFDEGESWQASKITSERLPNAWSTWEYLWQPRAKGEHQLSVRVKDAVGTRQIEGYTGSFPSGSTGLHRVIVTV
ncbi:MAG: molybdopterin-dependent oxidoreductase [Acidobacteria bacterium]|nr:molybdopterin-dependent oxidoreductase [Acidobacteriota bacterium]